MDVATWLEALGLGQYAPAFVENDIDLALLSSVISVWPGPASATSRAAKFTESPSTV
jgi:hypothetical protein